MGGFNSLKPWLEIRRAAFLAGEKEKLLDQPKGILLADIQGSGKGFAAKAVAGM